MTLPPGGLGVSGGETGWNMVVLYVVEVLRYGVGVHLNVRELFPVTLEVHLQVASC